MKAKTIKEVLERKDTIEKMDELDRDITIFLATKEEIKELLKTHRDYCGLATFFPKEDKIYSSMIPNNGGLFFFKEK